MQASYTLPLAFSSTQASYVLWIYHKGQSKLRALAFPQSIHCPLAKYKAGMFAHKEEKIFFNSAYNQQTVINI